ncbi:MAG: hypothetical protein WC966_04300 [Bradymonadales bacterium]|jgi:hypothetical protein
MSTVLEVIGYIGSVVIITSLMMTSIVKLRVINAIGAVIIVVFSILTNSYPNALMNMGAFIIDIYYLYRIKNVRESFELVKANPESDYFKWFYNKNYKEIEKFNESIDYLRAEMLYYYVRNNEVAGLLAWNKGENGEAKILLDFVTPAFRDCKVGRYFFSHKNAFFRKNGVLSFVTYTNNSAHANYLKKINFSHIDGEKWVKSLV